MEVFQSNSFWEWIWRHYLFFWIKCICLVQPKGWHQQPMWAQRITWLLHKFLSDKSSNLPYKHWGPYNCYNYKDNYVMCLIIHQLGGGESFMWIFSGVPLCVIFNCLKKCSPKYTITHKLTNNATFWHHLIFLAQLSCNRMHRIVGYQKAARDTSMLPSKFDQKKIPLETGSKAEFRLGRDLMPSRLGMLPPKAAF